MNDKVEKLIKSLNLQPHQEGGYFREFYRSSETAYISAKYQGLKSLNAAIYYLLSEDDRTKFHRLKCDEIWHHYDGGVLTLYIINAKGEIETYKLGKDGNYTVMVAKGQWFAAKVTEGEYVLAGCTTSPGFEYSDFELTSGDNLIKEYPALEEIIKDFI